MELREYTADELVALLPVPADNANKYTRGKLTAVVGCDRYPGAACLAAFASQRMGAGYTEVITAPSSVDIVRAFRPSLVVRPWDTWEVRSSVPTRPGNPFACLVGSGFDAADDRLVKLVHRVLKQVEAPVVVDAGGLAALTSTKGQRLLRRRFIHGWPTVVTPHGGEAARLAKPFNLPTEDPAVLAQNLSLAYGAVAMVKGADTFISDGDQVVRMGEGTAALAKAGTGDVLAGMVGALLAQGLSPADAAALAATLHAGAGRQAAAQLTAIAVTAEDVIDALPAAIVALAHA